MPKEKQIRNRFRIFYSKMDVRCAVILILFCPEILMMFCPMECSCHQKQASCINKNLTFIPKFPFQIESINFTLNILPNISKETFLNLTHLKLRYLRLVECAITSIEKDSFSVLKHLHYLDISGNYLKHDNLKVGLEGLKNTNLLHLVARNLYLNSTNGIFLSLYKSNLSTIDLSNNFIHFLNGSDFKGFQTLQFLNFYENKIQKLDFNGLHNLLHLNLKFNRFEHVPIFCLEGKASKLEVLDISGNLINSFSKNDFNGTCFPRLKTLLIGENAARFLPDNLISDLPSIVFFNLEWMRSSAFHFSPFTFNSTSLKRLYLSNHIHGFFLNINFKNIFQLCPNLITLVMTSIKLGLGALDGEALLTMLRPLTKLEKLILSNTNLRILSNKLLQKMTILKEVDLSNNKLSNWGDDVFKGLNKLKSIDLSSNHIALVNKTSFPSNILKNLDKLNLEHNPFSCICESLWFQNYLQTHNTTFMHGYPKELTCNSPVEMQGLSIMKYNPSFLQCVNPLKLTLVGVGLGLGVLLIVFLVVYRFRWNIKYYIYLIRAKKGYQALQGENQDFEYDAFVAYNYEDRIWVISKLVVFLEKQNGYKLCLHDRDFVVGKLIVDNICDENKKSRKTILVLSNNFAKSHWCQFELTLAQARQLKENENHLIVVLLGGIKGKYLTNDIKILLSSTTFIEWHQADKDNQMFWDRLLKAMND